MKTIKKQLEEAKTRIKGVKKQDVVIGVSLGVSSGLALAFGGELIRREIISRQVFQYLKDGNVVEKAYEDGSKLVIKILKAGEEACACELH